MEHKERFEILKKIGEALIRVHLELNKKNVALEEQLDIMISQTIKSEMGNIKDLEIAKELIAHAVHLILSFSTQEKNQ